MIRETACAVISCALLVGCSSGPPSHPCGKGRIPRASHIRACTALPTTSRTSRRPQWNLDGWMLHHPRHRPLPRAMPPREWCSPPSMHVGAPRTFKAGAFTRHQPLNGSSIWKESCQLLSRTARRGTLDRVTCSESKTRPLARVTSVQLEKGHRLLLSPDESADASYLDPAKPASMNNAIVDQAGRDDTGDA